MPARTTRRELLKASAGASIALAADGSAAAQEPTANHRPKLAIVITSYFAGSHGVCYPTKFMEGKQFDDHFEPALCDVGSMHLIEVSKNDVGIETARRNGVPLFPTVANALCLGGDELAVDGVVLIG